MEQLKPCPCCGGKAKLDSYPALNGHKAEPTTAFGAIPAI